ncbi:hypothetical protein WS97_00425 [Burkholderia territorii]|uniref:hypothetical protein n=1 Tax=Burkholderia territorii TaxID=1503055 RepID=UPI000756BC0D|nr:hypothetical protein [Burkholderia territorii]KVL25423.1 hypothetical protein WS97_00425 [Burkholderia territorii]
MELLTNHDAKRVYEALRDQVEQWQAAFPDQAIMLVETLPAGVSSGNRGALERKALLQSVSLHPDGTIWFNAVPGTRAGDSAGIWHTASMRVALSSVKRTELAGIAAPDRVAFSELGAG